MTALRSFLFGTGETSRAIDLGLLVLRVGLGLPMALAHGLGKIPPSAGFVEGTAEMGFPAPLFFAWAAGISEFLGGLCLAFGLGTRPAALMISITMFVAAFVRHAADPFAQKEKAIVFLVGALALLLAGGGRYALDRYFRAD